MKLSSGQVKKMGVVICKFSDFVLICDLFFCVNDQTFVMIWKSSWAEFILKISFMQHDSKSVFLGFIIIFK